MKFICPRCIRANRGDLLSRYGILSHLWSQGIRDLQVFCHDRMQLQPLGYATLPYGPLYNLWPGRKGLAAYRDADTVLWTAGLDLQDDSSLLKILHTLLNFLFFRLLGLKILVISQGAGPIRTRWGRFLTRLLLDQTSGFLVRDGGSLNLLRGINPRVRIYRGFDGIFLGDFDLSSIPAAEENYIEHLQQREIGQPLIGFNLRLWFHFSSGLLPYHLAPGKYRARAQKQLAEFIKASTIFLMAARRELNAKILMVSMYEPWVEPWEDDLPLLRQVKDRLAGDDQVVLVDQPLGLQGFCKLISGLDAMVGTRLHSTLAALRFGVPAVHLAYTLKGRDIFRDLGLSDYVVELERFIADPLATLAPLNRILSSHAIKGKISSLVQEVIARNQLVFNNLLQENR